MIDPFSKKLTNLIQINRFLKVCQPSKETNHEVSFQDLSRKCIASIPLQQ